MASPASNRALRAAAGGGIDAEAVAAKARELAVMGWVRPTGEIHAEGEPDAVQALMAFVGDVVPTERARVEGHEQFAIRGVSAGVFVVQEHQATAHHYDLRLEVDGVMRSWAVPKGPSLDPPAKRLAVEVEDHGLDHNDFEGTLGEGGVIVWDRGTYEQGGRVAWPEALERGHAVFVLHGEKLRGGFALQRTRRGAKPQWLLIKRRDDEARAWLGHRHRAARVGHQRPDAGGFARLSMSVFREAEIRYLAGGRQLGRIATVGADGTPHVVPVAWIYNAVRDAIDVGGHELEQSKKFRDVARSGRAAIVIDDLASTDPWHPRGIEIRGRGEAIALPTPLIRIHPERIVSWGLEAGRSARTVAR